MIEVEEPSEPLKSLDRAIVVFGDRFWNDEAVAQALVGPLSVVVLDVLLDDEPEVRNAERDDVVEAFASNGADEALSVGVEIGTAGR